MQKKILEINYTKILSIRSNGDRLCISCCDLDSIGNSKYYLCVLNEYLDLENEMEMMRDKELVGSDNSFIYLHSWLREKKTFLVYD